ncbi:hypothetical protein [Thiocapsa imhoffii]|uniref:hypothetical protein n=1 Tax=Thiocapsa imhoffii TaxID=382777 RepID=UPI001907EF31|nr:hypothetical protein [Thiocapsa imhoffii]
MEKTFPLTWVAAGLGLILAFILIVGGATGPSDGPRLPLLTLLFISEFGFLVTAGGVFWAFRTRNRADREKGRLIAAVACVALALGFLLVGISLWTGMVGGLPNVAGHSGSMALG